MIVLIDKSFEKDTNKINDKTLLIKIAECIEDVILASDIKDVKGIKKLSGYKKEYRIRIGNYRLGLIVENNKVEFIRCLHRKDIYKYFPK